MGEPADDFAPPSYSEATTTTNSRPFNSPLSPSSTTTTTTTTTTLPHPLSPPQTGLPLPSPLTNHLRTLPARLRATQLAQRTAQAADEFELTARVVPLVEAFLADLTTRPRVPALAELTLVPAGVVPAGASMSGARERAREGEVVEVGWVDVDGVGAGGFALGGAGDGKGKGVVGSTGDRKGGREGESGLRERVDTAFGEWGRFDTFENTGAAGKESEWWFTDEDMAHRLATYLRPEPNLQRRHVQASVVERKVVEKEKTGWGRFGLGGGRKKAAEQSSPVLSPPTSPALSSPGSIDDDDQAKMTVRAEEVTFRWENDFGVWESLTGWGVVVTVRVKL